MTARPHVRGDLGTAATSIGCAEAFDAAFAGRPCTVVRADGSRSPLLSQAWSGAASTTDVALFVEPCRGPTLDVGCGPGRLTGALHARGVDVLGIDTSTEAVRLTLARGAMALRRDVFDYVPAGAGWSHVLLADGNIGLGGDPVRLLRRLRRLLHHSGTILAELAKPGVRSVAEHLRLQVGDSISRPFAWSVVGVDDVERVATRSGLRMTGLRHHDDRFVATLGLDGT